MDISDQAYVRKIWYLAIRCLLDLEGGSIPYIMKKECLHLEKYRVTLRNSSCATDKPGRKTNRQAYKQPSRNNQTNRSAESQIGQQLYRQAGWLAGWPPGKMTDRQRNGTTDRQTQLPTDDQTRGCWWHSYSARVSYQCDFGLISALCSYLIKVT